MEPLSSELLGDLKYYMFGKWCETAAVILFVYECLITIDMEVELVWKSNWKFTTVLYLLNRYTVVLDALILELRSCNTRASSCRALFLAGVAFFVAGIYLSEWIFIMRVIIVWKMTVKKYSFLIVSLMTIYTASVIYMLTSFYLWLHSLEFLTPLPFKGCMATKPEMSLWIDHALLLIHDAVILVLMIYPVLKAYVSPYQTDFARHVYIEGMLYYVYLLCLDVVCLITQLVLIDYTLLFMIPIRIIRSMLAARIILHIREFSIQDSRDTTFFDETSTIRFH